jgi:hypothetical protein
MRVELAAPAFATHLLSDLTDWQRAPVPVAELTPLRPARRRLLRVRLAGPEGRRPRPRSGQHEPAPESLVGIRQPPGRPGLAAGPRCRSRRTSCWRRAAACSSWRSSRASWASGGTLLVYSPAGLCRGRPLPAGALPGRQGLLQGWGRTPQVYDRLHGPRRGGRRRTWCSCPRSRAHAGVLLQPWQVPPLPAGGGAARGRRPAWRSSGRRWPGAPAWGAC